MTETEIMQLYQQHQAGATCAEISRRSGHHRDWAAVLFKQHGLKVRSASETKTLESQRHAKTVKMPRNTGLPDGYTVRLVIHEGVYHAVLYDEAGQRLSAGVPASPFEIALWRELKHLKENL